MKKSFVILALACFIALTIWLSGKPVGRSLAAKSDVKLTPWYLSKDQQKEFGNFAGIPFSIPDGFIVDIVRQEDFATYKISNPQKVPILMMYFGNHCALPHKRHCFDQGYKTTKGDLNFEIVYRWSFFSVSKEEWICRSPYGWGVLAWYGRLSKQDAALADKIIESIQPPMKPND